MNSGQFSRGRHVKDVVYHRKLTILGAIKQEIENASGAIPLDTLANVVQAIVHRTLINI